MKLYWVCGLFTAFVAAAQPQSLANQNELDFLNLLAFISRVEIAHLQDALSYNVLPETIDANEVQSIIKDKQYGLSIVLEDLPTDPSKSCVYDFTTVRNPSSFLGTAQTLSAVGLSARVGFLREAVPKAWNVLWAIGDGIESESRHEAAFLHRSAQTIEPDDHISRFNVSLTPTWAYNLVRPFVVAGSCVEPELLRLPSIEIIKQDARRVLVRSVGTIGNSSMAWVNGTNVPVYTPLTLTSNTTGVAQIPDGMSGLVLALLTSEKSPELKRLSQDTRAGPRIVDVVGVNDRSFPSPRYGTILV